MNKIIHSREVRFVIGRLPEWAAAPHLFEALLAHTSDGVCIVDREHRYLALNEGIARLNGVPIEKHVGATVSDVLGSRAAPIRAFVDRVFTTGESSEHVMDISQEWDQAKEYRLSGRFFPIRGPGGEVTAVGVAVRAGDGRIRATILESRLVAIATSSVDAIVGVDLEGRVTFANDAAERLFELCSTQLPDELGAASLPIGPGLDAESLFAQLRRGQVVRDHQTSRRDSTGRTRHLALTAVPLIDGGGGLLGFALTYRDVTEQVEADRQRAFLERLELELAGNDTAAGLMHAGLRALGDYFSAVRCAFGIVTPDEEGVEIVGFSDARNAGTPRLHHSLSAFPEAVRAAMRGLETVAIEDAHEIPGFEDARRQAQVPRGARGLLVVPVGSAGRWTATLGLMTDAPRRWSSADVLVARALAERLWLAYENARLIEELRAREEKALDLAARLNLALSAARMGTWEVDFETQQMRGSPELSRLLGREGEELPTSSAFFESLVHPDDRQELAVAAPAIAAGKPFRLEARILRPDGSWLWVAACASGVLQAGKPMRYIGVAYDIDALKRTEHELRESQRLLTDAMRAGRVVAFEGDVAGHSVRRSANAADVLGEELATATIDEFIAAVPEEDREPLAREVDRALTASPEYDVDYRIVRPDGRTVWIAEHGRREYDAEGRAVRVRGMMVDVTMRREAEIARAKTVEALAAEQSWRERLFAILAHDLRTPVTVARLSAELLLRRPSDERQATLARRVHSAILRTQRLVSDLLDFAQLRAGTFPLSKRACSWKEIVPPVVSELAASRPGAEISTELEGLEGRWDADRLSQVVSNLVGNALQHGVDGQVSVRTFAQGSESVLEVTNAGEIPENLLPVIFDPFRRSEFSARESGSVGLGLYIAREIVVAHGGRIEVVNGEGAVRFRVSLPAA